MLLQHARFFNSNDYLSMLCTQNDFVLIQEHWLWNLNLAHISKLSSVHVTIFVLAGYNDNLSVGHPYGGLSILAKNNLIIRADLGASIKNLVHAVFFEFSGEKFVVFNIYLPCLSNDDDYKADLLI